MNRRLPATKPGPRLENQRGEEPTPACLGKPEPFDVLHEQTRGPEFREAHRQARDMCLACSLRPACWTENADTDWVKAVRKAPRPVPQRDCGTPDAVNRHRRLDERLCDKCVTFETERRRGGIVTPKRTAATKQDALKIGRGEHRRKLDERNAARADELRHLNASGATLYEACAALGVSRDTLNKWCSRHGFGDVYRALGSRTRKVTAA